MSVNETVGVVGLGYVGLPLALAMSDSGYDVVGVDIDEARVAELHAGESYVSDVASETVANRVGDGFEPTTDYSALSEAVGVSVCVPTPLRKTGQPDISYVADAIESLANSLLPPCTVVLESTVYPGATEEIVAPTLAENGYDLGAGVQVAFSPERIDPGNEEYGPREIPKVIGGVTSACTDAAVALYEPVFDEIVPVDSSTEAEMVKLLENTFRSVNIALINEVAMIAHELDVDIWSVVQAAASKPFGFMPFYPGPGLGGHCIPVDPLYLSWKANQQGASTRFIELADQINRDMPIHVVHRVESLLNKAGVLVPEADVVVLGVAYKSGVSDTRESPALDIMIELATDGARLCYHDPHVPSVSIGDRDYKSRPFDRTLLEESDCVILVTDHNEIDIKTVVDAAPLVFDARNATTGVNDGHVHRL